MCDWEISPRCRRSTNVTDDKSQLRAHVTSRRFERRGGRHICDFCAAHIDAEMKALTERTVR